MQKLILLISVQKELDIIGLKYLHYYLLENGYHSTLLQLPNFNNDSLRKIGDFTSKISPLFIGISLMSIEYYDAQNLTWYLKNFLTTPIIWGGIHPTISPEMCLKCADYVCIGEGERTVLDFANALSNHEDVKTINNLCYKEAGRIKRNRLYPLIENLDEMPLCDHIPINSFLQEKDGRIVPIDRKIFKRYSRFRGSNYRVMTSRGCPFSCTYCCNNFLSSLYPSRKVRRRSIENVILELEKVVRDNPEIECINIQDDCFLAGNDEYFKEFARLYKNKVKKPFIVRGIPIYITPTKLKHLKDAGLAWVALGLQSGSDHVCRDTYKRKSLKADFLRAARIVKDLNIAPIYDVILDNPFEDEEDGLETIRTFIETPKPFYVQFFSLSLFSGTQLYERAKKECPEEIEDSLRKNYRTYHKTTINTMIRISAFLNKGFMNWVVRLHKQNPRGVEFKIVLFIANLLSQFIFEPIAYFRVLMLSEGSYVKMSKALLNYSKHGIMRYLKRGVS